MGNKYYAVKTGKTPGIYNSWAECQKQVIGVSGAVFKSFPSLQEAKVFMQLDIPENSTVDDSENIVSDKENAVAYVDGSYNVSTGQFSYGIVMFYDGKEHHLSKRIEDEELATMRNVAGEIMGAKAAIEFALEQDCKNITIYHDYEGIAKWCLGLWKTNKEGTKAYKEFYDFAKEKINIKFIKVKGHSNNKYNDLADELAKKEIFS